MLTFIRSNLTNLHVMKLSVTRDFTQSNILQSLVLALSLVMMSLGIITMMSLRTGILY